MPGKIRGLFRWCLKVTEGYEGVELLDMTNSWKNGLAFCAIINRFRPDLIDFYSLSPDNVYDNNNLAYTIMEREFDVPRLLDPTDMVEMNCPDRYSIATYVSAFYECFNDKPMHDPPPIPENWTADQSKGKRKQSHITDEEERNKNTKSNRRNSAQKCKDTKSDESVQEVSCPTEKDLRDSNKTKQNIVIDTVSNKKPVVTKDFDIDDLYKESVGLLQDTDSAVEESTYKDMCKTSIDDIKSSKPGAVLQAVVMAGVTAVAPSTIGDDAFIDGNTEMDVIYEESKQDDEHLKDVFEEKPKQDNEHLKDVSEHENERLQDISENSEQNNEYLKDVSERSEQDNEQLKDVLDKQSENCDDSFCNDPMETVYNEEERSQIETQINATINDFRPNDSLADSGCDMDSVLNCTTELVNTDFNVTLASSTFEMDKSSLDTLVTPVEHDLIPEPIETGIGKDTSLEDDKESSNFGKELSQDNKIVSVGSGDHELSDNAAISKETVDILNYELNKGELEIADVSVVEDKENILVNQIDTNSVENKSNELVMDRGEWNIATKSNEIARDEENLETQNVNTNYNRDIESGKIIEEEVIHNSCKDTTNGNQDIVQDYDQNIQTYIEVSTNIDNANDGLVHDDVDEQSTSTYFNMFNTNGESRTMHLAIDNTLCANEQVDIDSKKIGEDFNEKDIAKLSCDKDLNLQKSDNEAEFADNMATQIVKDVFEDIKSNPEPKCSSDTEWTLQNSDNEAEFAESMATQIVKDVFEDIKSNPEVLEVENDISSIMREIEADIEVQRALQSSPEIQNDHEDMQIIYSLNDSNAVGDGMITFKDVTFPEVNSTDTYPVIRQPVSCDDDEPGSPGAESPPPALPLEGPPPLPAVGPPILPSQDAGDSGGFLPVIEDSVEIDVSLPALIVDLEQNVTNTPVHVDESNDNVTWDAVIPEHVELISQNPSNYQELEPKVSNSLEQEVDEISTNSLVEQSYRDLSFAKDKTSYNETENRSESNGEFEMKINLGTNESLNDELLQKEAKDLSLISNTICEKQISIEEISEQSNQILEASSPPLTLLMLKDDPMENKEECHSEFGQTYFDLIPKCMAEEKPGNNELGLMESADEAISSLKHSDNNDDIASKPVESEVIVNENSDLMSTSPISNETSINLKKGGMVIQDNVERDQNESVEDENLIPVKVEEVSKEDSEKKYDQVNESRITEEESVKALPVKRGAVTLDWSTRVSDSNGNIAKEVSLEFTSPISCDESDAETPQGQVIEKSFAEIDKDLLRKAAIMSRKMAEKVTMKILDDQQIDDDNGENKGDAMLDTPGTPPPSPAIPKDSAKEKRQTMFALLQNSTRPTKKRFDEDIELKEDKKDLDFASKMKMWNRRSFTADSPRKLPTDVIVPRKRVSLSSPFLSLNDNVNDKDKDTHMARLTSKLPDKPAPGSVAAHIRKLSEKQSPCAEESLYKNILTRSDSESTSEKSIDGNEQDISRTDKEPYPDKSDNQSDQPFTKDVKPSTIFAARPLARMRSKNHNVKLGVRPMSLEAKYKGEKDADSAKPPIPPIRQSRKSLDRVSVDIKPLEKKPNNGEDSSLVVDKEGTDDLNRQDSLRKRSSPRRSLSLSSPTRPEVRSNSAERERNVWVDQSEKPPSPNLKRSDSFEVKIRPVTTQKSQEEKAGLKREKQLEEQRIRQRSPSRPPTPTKSLPKVDISIKPVTALELSEQNDKESQKPTQKSGRRSLLSVIGSFREQKEDRNPLVTNVSLSKSTTQNDVPSQIKLQEHAIPDGAKVQEAIIPDDLAFESKLQHPTIPDDVSVEAKLQEQPIQYDISIETKLQESTIPGDISVEEKLKGSTIKDMVPIEAKLQEVTIPDDMSIDAKLQEVNIPDDMSVESKLQENIIPDTKSAEQKLQEPEVSIKKFSSKLYNLIKAAVQEDQIDKSKETQVANVENKIVKENDAEHNNLIINEDILPMLASKAESSVIVKEEIVPNLALQAESSVIVKEEIVPNLALQAESSTNIEMEINKPQGLSYQQEKEKTIEKCNSIFSSAKSRIIEAEEKPKPANEKPCSSIETATVEPGAHVTTSSKTVDIECKSANLEESLEEKTLRERSDSSSNSDDSTDEDSSKRSSSLNSSAEIDRPDIKEGLKSIIKEIEDEMEVHCPDEGESTGPNNMSPKTELIHEQDPVQSKIKDVAVDEQMLKPAFELPSEMDNQTVKVHHTIFEVSLNDKQEEGDLRDRDCTSGNDVDCIDTRMVSNDDDLPSQETGDKSDVDVETKQGKKGKRKKKKKKGKCSSSSSESYTSDTGDSDDGKEKRSKSFDQNPNAVIVTGSETVSQSSDQDRKHSSGSGKSSDSTESNTAPSDNVPDSPEGNEKLDNNISLPNNELVVNDGIHEKDFSEDICTQPLMDEFIYVASNDESCRGDITDSTESLFDDIIKAVDEILLPTSYESDAESRQVEHALANCQPCGSFPKSESDVKMDTNDDFLVNEVVPEESVKCFEINPETFLKKSNSSSSSESNRGDNVASSESESQEGYKQKDISNDEIGVTTDNLGSTSIPEVRIDTQELIGSIYCGNLQDELKPDILNHLPLDDTPTGGTMDTKELEKEHSSSSTCSEDTDKLGLGNLSGVLCTEDVILKSEDMVDPFIQIEVGPPLNVEIESFELCKDVPNEIQGTETDSTHQLVIGNPSNKNNTAEDTSPKSEPRKSPNDKNRKKKRASSDSCSSDRKEDTSSCDSNKNLSDDTCQPTRRKSHTKKKRNLVKPLHNAKDSLLKNESKLLNNDPAADGQVILKKENGYHADSESTDAEDDKSVETIQKEPKRGKPIYSPEELEKQLNLEQDNGMLSVINKTHSNSPSSSESSGAEMKEEAVQHVHNKLQHKKSSSSSSSSSSSESADDKIFKSAHQPETEEFKVKTTLPYSDDSIGVNKTELIKKNFSSSSSSSATSDDEYTIQKEINQLMKKKELEAKSEPVNDTKVLSNIEVVIEEKSKPSKDANGLSDSEVIIKETFPSSEIGDDGESQKEFVHQDEVEPNIVIKMAVTYNQLENAVEFKLPDEEISSKELDSSSSSSSSSDDSEDDDVVISDIDEITHKGNDRSRVKSQTLLQDNDLFANQNQPSASKTVVSMEEPSSDLVTKEIDRKSLDESLEKRTELRRLSLSSNSSSSSADSDNKQKPNEIVEQEDDLLKIVIEDAQPFKAPLLETMITVDTNQDTQEDDKVTMDRANSIDDLYSSKDEKQTDDNQYLLPECNMIMIEYDDDSISLKSNELPYNILDIDHKPDPVDIQVFVLPDSSLDSFILRNSDNRDVIFVKDGSVKGEMNYDHINVLPQEQSCVIDGENILYDDLNNNEYLSPRELNEIVLEPLLDSNAGEYTEQGPNIESEDELLQNIIQDQTKTPTRRRRSSSTSSSSSSSSSSSKGNINDENYENVSETDEHVYQSLGDEDLPVMKQQADDEGEQFEDGVIYEDIDENDYNKFDKPTNRVTSSENNVSKNDGSSVFIDKDDNEISVKSNSNESLSKTPVMSDTCNSSKESPQELLNDNLEEPNNKTKYSKERSDSSSSSSNSGSEKSCGKNSSSDSESESSKNESPCNKPVESAIIDSEVTAVIESQIIPASSTVEQAQRPDQPEEFNFMIGREKDPSKSEVARLIQQSLELDRKREELQRQEQERLHEQVVPRDEVLERDHHAHNSTVEREEENVDLDESSVEDEVEAEEKEISSENQFSEEYQAGDATPMSMPSGVDTDNSVSSPEEGPVVEVFDLQESSSEDISPDMESQALFVKLKEAQCRNAVLEAELAKLKARLIVLENSEAQKKQFEKKNEEMANRLRETEKALMNARKEINHYQDLLEGSQGQYIKLEKKLSGDFTALEKKYHKAKKLIKEYQQREKDFLAERESLLQQQTEKDQQYNALVKSLKDKIFLLEKDLREAQKAAGLPVLGQTKEQMGQKSEPIVTAVSAQQTRSAPPVHDSGSMLMKPLSDRDSSVSSESEHTTSDITSPEEELKSEKVNLFESMPVTQPLDTSASKAKAQVANNSRRPPTKQRSKSQDSDEMVESANNANKDESGLETWIKHDSDNTVKKSDVRKRRAQQQGSETQPPLKSPSTPESEPGSPPGSFPSVQGSEIEPRGTEAESLPPPPPPPQPSRPQTDTPSETDPYTTSRERNDSESEETSSTVSQSSYDPSNPNFVNKDSEIPSLAPSTVGTSDSQDVESETSSLSAKKSKGFNLPKLPFKFGGGERDKGGVMLVSSRSLNTGDEPTGGEGGITLISKRKLDTDFDGASTISTVSDTSSGYMVGEQEFTSYNFSGTPANEEHPSQPSSRAQNQFQSCPIAEWNIEHVRNWLIGVEMDKYIPLFNDQSMTGTQLVSMDANKFKALGITSSKDRDFLKKKVKELKLVLDKERKQQEKERKQFEKEQKLKEKEQKKLLSKKK